MDDDTTHSHYLEAAYCQASQDRTDVYIPRWKHVSNKFCTSNAPSDIVFSGLGASLGRFIVGLNTNALPDLTWVAPELTIWIQVEPGCYLISACLLTLRPLLDRIMNANCVQGSRRKLYRAFRWTVTGTSHSTSAGSNIEMKKPPFATVSKGSVGKGFSQLAEEGSEGSNVKSVMGTIVVGADEVDVELGKDRGHTRGGSKVSRPFQPRIGSVPDVRLNDARTFFQQPTSADG